MTSVTKSTTYSVQRDGREFSIEFEPQEDSIMTRRRSDGGWVVGYLSRDNDPMSPLDNSDGMGQIIDGRHDKSFWEHVALANAEDDKHDWPAMLIESPRGDAHICHRPLSVLLDVYSHSGEAWRVHGWDHYFPDEQWDVSHGCGVWIPDDSCIECIEFRAKDGGDKQDIAREIAAGVVKEYNSYLAGDVWGVCVEKFDEDGFKVDEDACWGYLGREYAERELKGSVESI